MKKKENLFNFRKTIKCSDGPKAPSAEIAVAVAVITIQGSLNTRMPRLLAKAIFPFLCQIQKNLCKPNVREVVQSTHASSQLDRLNFVSSRVI